MRLIAILLVCLLLTGCPVPNDSDTKPAPPQPTTPLAVEMKALAIEIEPVSLPELAVFYRDFADVVRRDAESKIIRTTGDLREAHSRAGRLAFQKTGMQEKTPGLGDKIDSVLAKGIGLPNVALTPPLRERAVAVFDALANALE